jgi:hypothetical protein
MPSKSLKPAIDKICEYYHPDYIGFSEFDDTYCLVMKNDMICEINEVIKNALEGKWWKVPTEVIDDVFSSGDEIDNKVRGIISIINKPGFFIENDTLFSKHPDGLTQYDFSVNPVTNTDIANNFISADFTISMVSEGCRCLYLYDGKSDMTTIRSKDEIDQFLRTPFYIKEIGEGSYKYVYKLEGKQIFSDLGLI